MYSFSNYFLSHSVYFLCLGQHKLSTEHKSFPKRFCSKIVKLSFFLLPFSNRFTNTCSRTRQKTDLFRPNLPLNRKPRPELARQKKEYISEILSTVICISFYQ